MVTTKKNIIVLMIAAALAYIAVLSYPAYGLEINGDVTGAPYGSSQGFSAPGGSTGGAGGNGEIVPGRVITPEGTSDLPGVTRGEEIEGTTRPADSWGAKPDKELKEDPMMDMRHDSYEKY